ncbi:Hypothetical protein CINCED_3A016023 [Cinara cedri]|nr:Hypothetical protein CINCED_3A016023 [Cinara cedri]
MLRMEMYVSCIKIFGVPIVPPLMTDEKKQQMKEFKEKAMAFENKLKGKRISLDSGVMTASVEMQKLDNYESPTNVLKEIAYCDANGINTIPTENKMETESSVSPETPTLVSEEKHILKDSVFDKNLLSKKADNVSLNGKSCDSLNSKQESNHILTISNLTIRDGEYLNDNSLSNKQSSIIKSENVATVENSCGTLISKQESTKLLTVTNANCNDKYNATIEQTPRLRTNSYTLSSPSPIMVAFLNSQVQQQLIEPKGLENNVNSTKESKSEPCMSYAVNNCDENILKVKSISLHSVPDSFNNQAVINNLAKYKQLSITDKHIEDQTIFDQSQLDERGSVTTIGTNFSNDESIVGSVVTICNENDRTSSPMTYSKSIKNCCCRHSDDEYSLCSNNTQYQTPEELNLEVERLRIEKLDIEKRHQDELAYLIKKQREEQEQIAVRYYLITRSTSGMSLDDSEYSVYSSKHMKSNSLSSSIISNCSSNKNLVSSSPRPKTPSNSPLLQQNIKFYHRIRGSLGARWSRAPSEVEHSAATIINAGVRGYLTRRLLRTEKAQLLKKTILDSLKTALVMHMELKKQKPTESDLELHRRIINQLTTACYDLNDLILGSIHERMIIIRSDRERLMAVKMRRRSSSGLITKLSRSSKQ